MGSSESGAGSRTTTLATIVIVVAALYFAREVFIPFALAVLLSFMLAPLVIRLRHWGLGRVPAVLAAVSLSTALMLGTAWLLTIQLYDLANKLPNYQQTMQAKLRSFKVPGEGLVEKTSRLFRETKKELDQQAKSRDRSSTGAEKTAPTASPEATTPIPVEVHEREPTSWQLMQGLLGSVWHPLATAGIVIIFVVFMLIHREDLRDRVLRLVGLGRLSLTTQALDDAARRVSRYLLMQLVVNVTYGVPLGIGLYFIGVPNAFLWGLMATVLRFIPYVGPWIAASFPVVLAFAVDPGWSMLFLTGALFVVIELLSNNVVEPWLYGSSTGISPVAIIMAAVFWTWLWGPVGLLLSTPLTVCLVVLGRYVPQLKFLSILLGDEPVLTEEARFYQRMVAQDPDEALELAQAYLKEHPLVEFYDRVVIPALILAEQDHQRGLLNEDKHSHIWPNIRALVEDLADHKDIDDQAISESGAPSLAEKRSIPKPEHQSVLCIPARTEADEIAALILSQLLHRRCVPAKPLSATALTGEYLEELKENNLDLVCVSKVAPPGIRPVRYLCKRLRNEMPNLKVIIGLWGVTEDRSDLRDRLGLAPSDIVVTRLSEAIEHIATLSSYANSEALEDFPHEANVS
jgi:predicted PurR-regulated permease PerM